MSLSTKILSGKILTGSHAVALNAGAGLFLMGRVSNILEGYQSALGHLKSGIVLEYFHSLKN